MMVEQAASSNLALHSGEVQSEDDQTWCCMVLSRCVGHVGLDNSPS